MNVKKTKSSKKIILKITMSMTLLLSSSSDDEIAKATEEQIHSLADGQMLHGYATLSLGFRMAVEAKRMHPLGIQSNSSKCMTLVARNFYAFIQFMQLRHV